LAGVVTNKAEIEYAVMLELSKSRRENSKHCDRPRSISRKKHTHYQVARTSCNSDFMWSNGL